LGYGEGSGGLQVGFTSVDFFGVNFLEYMVSCWFVCFRGSFVLVGAESLLR
jgi:hypothetical protein